MVIAGQGDRLLSVKSEDRQVIDFLKLVPAYMEKIKAVHTAVSHGNLDEVKKILTRKRFALCRDQYGASPLHLAVLHGHVDILIYIITQFPETIDGPDNVRHYSRLHYTHTLPRTIYLQHIGWTYSVALRRSAARQADLPDFGDRKCEQGTKGSVWNGTS